MTTLTPTHRLFKLAFGLIGTYRRVMDAKRPVDVQIATATLDGMCDAAYRLGVGMTPTMVRIKTQEAVHQAPPRPGWGAMNNRPQKEYDDMLAQELAERLEP